MLAQLLEIEAAPLAALAGGTLMVLNAVAAGWLIARPLRHAGGSAPEGEGTAA